MTTTFTPLTTGKTQTSVRIDLHDAVSGGENGSLPGQDQKRWLLEASNRPPIIPDVNQIGPVCSFFRVHPSAVDLILSTTSGSINANASQLQKHVFEIITFSGGNPWVELRYPSPTGVKFMIYGALVPAKPTAASVPITIVYDSTRNILKASQPCYGAVKVEYFAPYDLWLATFGYSTKPTPVIIDPLHPGDPDDDHPLSGLDPMTILGKYRMPPTGVDPDTIVASITLQPPTNPKQGQQLDPTTWAIQSGTDSQMSKLSLEIDPKDPVALKGSDGGKPSAGCSILITPAVEPRIKNFTSGRVISSANQGGRVIQEMLTFSGSGSTQLKYQPAGDLSLDIQGYFVDRNGKKIDGARLAAPGANITVVDWNPFGQPINARYRIVNVDEVVLLDGTGYTVQGYGIVKANYSVTQWKMQFRFDYDKDRKEFTPAWMIAVNGNDQTATLQLQPPTLKKVK